PLLNRAGVPVCSFPSTCPYGCVQEDSHSGLVRPPAKRVSVDSRSWVQIPYPPPHSPVGPPRSGPTGLFGSPELRNPVRVARRAVRAGFRGTPRSRGGSLLGLDRPTCTDHPRTRGGRAPVRRCRRTRLAGGSGVVLGWRFASSGHDRSSVDGEEGVFMEVGEVFADAFGRVQEEVHAVLDGLSQEELDTRPGPEAKIGRAHVWTPVT